MTTHSVRGAAADVRRPSDRGSRWQSSTSMQLNVHSTLRVFSLPPMGCSLSPIRSFPSRRLHGCRLRRQPEMFLKRNELNLRRRRRAIGISSRRDETRRDEAYSERLQMRRQRPAPEWGLLPLQRVHGTDKHDARCTVSNRSSLQSSKTTAAANHRICMHTTWMQITVVE